ncbi:uncharacterized protein involved in response to NO [Mycoplana sp. BE70]|nr:uncharacterized protein involved in response to NO [Mycoplana sp. BE70]
MFGTGGAAVGGYLLTALPAWTGRGTVSGVVTLSLSVLWIIARVGFVLAGSLPFTVQVAATLAYLLSLGAYLAWQLISARLWAKGWLLGPVFGLAAADFMLLSEPNGFRDGRAALVAVLIFALLINAIGGRAVPAFTRHWLERTKSPQRLQDSHRMSVFATGLMVAGLCLALVERDTLAGACLIGSGAVTLARMSGWRTSVTIRYPALLVLHLAWIWLPAGLLLVGLALLRPDIIGVATALHGLTMGAMGTMMLAIMGRAAMQRRGEYLVLSPTLAFAFILVWLSAPARIAAGLVPAKAIDPVPVAALLWMAGWALFLTAHLSALRRPIPHPVLSARSRS